MTKQEREQAVELLRCAADQSLSIARTGEHLGIHPNGMVALAIDARCGVDGEIHARGLQRDFDYYDTCLEAVQRVEDEEWP